MRSEKCSLLGVVSRFILYCLTFKGQSEWRVVEFPTARDMKALTEEFYILCISTDINLIYFFLVADNFKKPNLKK